MADHIAALLEHPDTPVELFNAVAEEVTELTSRHQLAREVLRVSLPLALGKSQRAVADHVVEDEETQAATVQLSACSCHKPDGYADTYPGITLERARELADFITSNDDEELCHAMLTLLYGIAHAFSHGSRLDAEGMIIDAVRAAYANTTHSTLSSEQFVALSQDDLRAVREPVEEDEK
ncbi:MAG TPA: hypothetical protein VEQ40_08455 [Pyrinomonadaceae bacterium]|nr:hypothetical protein [Pyrinomonadaceae bacterium]